MELTDKEKRVLEDQLKAEHLSICKYKLYADQSSDAQIKQAFNLVCEQKTKHVGILTSLLEEGGFNPPTPVF